MPLNSILRSPCWDRLTPLVAAALLITATVARADTIVYNSFGPGFTITPLGDTGTFTIGPPGTSEYFGAPFLPSATVDLTSLTGNWAAALTAAENTFPLTHPVPITISIWSGSSSEPSTELESWALTVDQTATNYTLSSTTNPELVAGDTYWVLADYTGAEAANNFLGWGTNSAATTLGLWDSETSATSLNLETFLDPQPALEVQGTLVATPEPSTLLLTGMCFLGILTRSFWRRPSRR
jgi:hypothetical protein